MSSRTRCQRSPRASVVIAYRAMARKRPPAAWPVEGSDGRCWRVAHHATAASAVTEMRTWSRSVRRCTVIEEIPTPAGLDRHAPQGEPPLQLGLGGQLAPDLRIELELALDGALLLARRRHEWIPPAALVVVDEVDGLALGVLEGEDRGQQPVA